jgi:hypothetical protein
MKLRTNIFESPFQHLLQKGTPGSPESPSRKLHPEISGFMGGHGSKEFCSPLITGSSTSSTAANPLSQTNKGVILIER